MKIILTLLILGSVILPGCKKHNTPDAQLDQTPDSTAVAKYKGTFSNGPYGSVSGKAGVYLQNGQYKLALENLLSSNGPDLHVYLSREVQPVNYIDLGRLQSTAGNQVYLINGYPDFSQYKYALVHCQRFNHLFGSAELR